MNKDYLLQQIRDEVRQGHPEQNLANAITGVLFREGLDLRREPSLETMKFFLAEAARTAAERQCTAC